MADGRNKSRSGHLVGGAAQGWRGIISAVVIISLWFFCLSIFLTYASQWPWWGQLVAVLIQTHLYTGVFITMHDSIHGVVSGNRSVNDIVGYLCAKLFAFNNFKRLSRKHHQHHQFAGTQQDPDFSANQNFFRWYAKFILEYMDGWQILWMALAFNALKFWIPDYPLVIFWMLPAVLSTFQLFYFGTYQPHKHPDELSAPHKARSQNLGHVRAFLSCYFFGYHYEHHIAPYLPWWKLAGAKEGWYKKK